MLLKINKLDVSFDNGDGGVVRAARDVSLELDRGEVLGLVGESGSGKSSVAMSIARLLPSPPAFYPQGKIFFEGKEMLSMPLKELRQLRGDRIGVIFQDPMSSLSPLHRVGEQIAECTRLHRKLSRETERALVLEWLAKVGIADPETRARAYPHELSGGMQQRVMIAMALINEPDLVIADEPTTALDVTVQAQILKLLKALTGDKSAVLLITHDLGVVSEMATKIAVMKDGRIIEKSDDVSAFFDAPHDEYSRTLVREAKRMSLNEFKL